MHSTKCNTAHKLCIKCCVNYQCVSLVYIHRCNRGREWERESEHKMSNFFDFFPGACLDSFSCESSWFMKDQSAIGYAWKNLCGNEPIVIVKETNYQAKDLHIFFRLSSVFLTICWFRFGKNTSNRFFAFFSFFFFSFLDNFSSFVGSPIQNFVIFRQQYVEKKVFKVGHFWFVEQLYATT